ncbi:MAG: hypothetical protein EBW73_13085, partial [Betaproteobacteria bacterium]|nr:hypothetical protein [Betaproteobacteria bacterium]
VQDPGNVGTLIRMAAAAAVDQVWLGAACADAWSWKVLRAAQGAHAVLPICERVDLHAQACHRALKLKRWIKRLKAFWKLVKGKKLAVKLQGRCKLPTVKHLSGWRSLSLLAGCLKSAIGQRLLIGPHEQGKRPDQAHRTLWIEPGLGPLVTG